MRIISASNRRTLERVLARDQRVDRALERRVRSIVGRVRDEGDAALLGFAKRFDRVSPPLEVTREEMQAAAEELPRSVRLAIAKAAGHIARVALRQIPKPWDLDVAPGVSVEQRVEPLARVGCY